MRLIQFIQIRKYECTVFVVLSSTLFQYIIKLLCHRDHKSISKLVNQIKDLHYSNLTLTISLTSRYSRIEFVLLHDFFWIIDNC